MFILFSVRFRMLIDTFWERAAHFVFFLFVILVIYHFGVEGLTWVLIASVPDHCFLVTFISFLLAQNYLYINILTISKVSEMTF